MEMSRATYYIKLVRISLCILLAAFIQNAAAQQMPVKYTIKDGRMVIEVSKKINYQQLDSFIAHYNLHDIPLKQFIQNQSIDSLKKLGWKLEANNKQSFIISKSLFAVTDINHPSDRIRFTQNPDNSIYPENVGSIVYGYNRFKNKYPFAANGSVTTFFLRNNNRANKVMLAGSFNNWQPDAVAMKKTDSGWIAQVQLEPGKHWYKFIVDGNWDVDTDNLLMESDGRGNVNSVFYKTNYTFKLDGYTNARKVYVAGSFNDWRRGNLELKKTASGWQLPLYLAEGTHTYKFVVDGKWLPDPKNEKRLPDGVNSYNSVVEFGKPYIFKLDGFTDARQVAVMGSFNNWRGFELFMKKTPTGWQLPYTLGPGNYEYRFIVDGKQITDPANPRTTSHIKNDGNSFLVIAPNYTFRLKGFSNAKTIFLAGDFNNWNSYTLPMKREDDTWTVTVNLSPGKHLYKYIVDGNWIIDPGNNLWEQNEFGTGNSVLWFGK